MTVREDTLVARLPYDLFSGSLMRSIEIDLIFRGTAEGRRTIVKRQSR